MKLFIDDRRKAPEGWDQAASNIAGAIRAIVSYGHLIDAISLDYDDGTDNTFEPVAHFIKCYYLDPAFLKGDRHLNIPAIYIHSGNPVGARRLEDILEGFDTKRVNVIEEVF